MLPLTVTYTRKKKSQIIKVSLGAKVNIHHYVPHFRKILNPLVYLYINSFYASLSQLVSQLQELSYTRLHPSRLQEHASV